MTRAYPEARPDDARREISAACGFESRPETARNGPPPMMGEGPFLWMREIRAQGYDRIIRRVGIAGAPPVRSGRAR